jgi:mRNA-degrading endonuclease RelE of RelBE toxin-antitoxin system
LAGELGGYFSYRIQDLRAVVDFVIEDGEILVIRVGWRKDVYD